ncbi:MAG: hypothetical protein IJW49_07275 [Clostridia bacterium]|nr:hypothetical protein [Clostridia bacterium]
MKIWNLIKKIFKSTCVYFTLISIVFMLLGIIGGNDASGIGFKSSALLFIPFGICMALAQELLCAKTLSALTRYLGHCAITLIAFVVLLSANADFTFAKLIVLIVLLLILYWIIFGIALLIRRRLKNLMEED